MPGMDLSTFERHQQAGLQARKAGQWDKARQELLQAADAARNLSISATGDDAKKRYRQIAIDLLELARDCQSAGGTNIPSAQVASPAPSAALADGPAKVATELSTHAAPPRAVTYDLFERYRDGGMAAWRRRDWSTAETFFTRAADTIEALAAETRDLEQRDIRLETARKLREKSTEAQGTSRGSPRAQPSVTRQEVPGESEGDKSADQWLVKERPSLRFDDVAGLEPVKQDIRLKMIYPFSHPELAQRFGIRGGGGVLLYGPPGTGKTMLAKATAGELDAAFFRVTPADMLSKWVGEAEQNIKKLFDAAAAEKRSVLFIDEIEALIPARRDEGSSVMQRVVPQILQGMEGFDKKSASSVLFMGATNVPWQLDPAVLRPGRFDEKVYIPLPDIAARKKMLEIYLSKRPLDVDVNLDLIAQKLDGFSGADIKYICDRSATIPFLQSIASGQDGLINIEIIDQVIRVTPKSVTQEMLQRFEHWSQSTATG